jgi:hypothetical protein
VSSGFSPSLVLSFVPFFVHLVHAAARLKILLSNRRHRANATTRVKSFAYTHLLLRRASANSVETKALQRWGKIFC